LYPDVILASRLRNWIVTYENVPRVHLLICSAPVIQIKEDWTGMCCFIAKHVTFMSINEQRVCLIVFNVTFNNISVISWRSVLLVICNQCLSPLMLWVRISIRARCTTWCDKVCQWLATGRWFSLGIPVYSTNKTDRHDITEILLKVTLNTIKQTLCSLILINVTCWSVDIIMIRFFLN
jgi:hypothetical protein